MNWKELFRPTVYKIILIALMVIILPFLYYYPCPTTSTETMPFAGISVEELLGIKCGFGFMSIIKLFSFYNYGIFYKILPFFIIDILIKYLVVCTMLNLYNKFRSQNATNA